MPTKTVSRFSEIQMGESAYIDFLVISAESKKNSKGGDFVDLTASDGDAAFPVKLWNMSLEQSGLSVGDVVRARIASKEFRGAPSLSVNGSFQIQPDKDASSFLVHPPIPEEEMMSRCSQRLARMREPLRALGEKLVLGNADSYSRWAAAASVHHGFLGGLLYHSYRMAVAADTMAGLYGCDADLAVLGCLIHDIGKLRELDTDWMGNATYTAEGQLKGHIVIGAEMLRDAARQIPGLDGSEDLVMLEHIIYSHHGKKEFGSPVEPMTKEAMLVSQLDMTDMKLEVWDENASALEPGQASASPIYSIGTRIYKPGNPARP